MDLQKRSQENWINHKR